MEVILEGKTEYNIRIKDFGVDPVSKRIITTGNKLIFSKDGKVEREVGSRLKNCEVIKYIKDKTQLFISGIFFVSTSAGKVYKCDARKKRILEEVYDFKEKIEALDFTTGGKIIYVKDKTVYLFDTDVSELVYSECVKDNDEEGEYSIFTSGENIVLKYKKENENINRINIFCNKLDKVFDIKTDNDHIHCKISGVQYIAGTDTGEIEIWDIIESELYDSIKVSSSKITYIEKTDEMYLIGTEKGELIITDNKFKIKNIKKILDSEISKICVIKEDIYILGSENKIIKLKMFDEADEFRNNIKRREFLQRGGIHEDYYDFFTISAILEIESFLKQLYRKGIKFFPEEENIFKMLRKSILSQKECVLGKGIYNMKPEETVWNSEEAIVINIPLTVPEDEISENEVEEHDSFWISFIKRLLNYISRKNKKISYIFIDKDMEIFEKDVSKRKVKYIFPEKREEIKEKVNEK